jgi:hypothetical protein
MTIYQFTLLNEQDKADLVLNSVFLADRMTGDMHFELYYLDNLFVEIWHDADTDRIYSMKPFSARRLPEAYLEQISIAEIAD